MRILAGVYPADPRIGALDEVAERSGCAGFEIPLASTFVADEGRMLDRLAESGRHVFTLLPASLERRVGLADPDAGRRGAVELVRRAHAAAVGLNAAAGRAVIDSVLLHSAPRVDATRVAEHRAALGDSLAELSEWDWGDVVPVLEHCDSYSGPAPLKGFLDLASELATGMSVAINWGRSYLDTGRMLGPVDHARRAADAGRLRILGVSGVSATAWADRHAPVGDGLLTASALAEFLSVGLPTQVIVKVGGSIDDVLHSLAETQKALAATASPAPH